MSTTSDDLWLGFTDQVTKNPLLERTAYDIEYPGLHEMRLMRNPEYLSWTADILCNVRLLPMQAAILEEVWTHSFPMLIMSRGGGKCNRDVYVTLDDGFYFINDLFIKDDPYETKIPVNYKLLGESGFRKPDYAWKKEPGPTIKLETSFGFQIEGSDIHPIRIVRNGEIVWEQLQNLRINDLALIDCSGEWFPNFNDFSEKDAYEFGCLVGRDEDAIDNVDMYRLVLSSSRISVGAFIRGVLEYKGQYKVPSQLVSVFRSKKLVKMLQFLLTRFSIISKVEYGDVHTLTIFGNNDRVFGQSLYSKLIHKDFLLPFYSFFYDPITKLEKGFNELYDFYIPDDHSYLSGGFISHNSFLLALYAILKCVLVPGTKVVIVGAAFRQSKIIFEYMESIWNHATVLRSVCDSSSGTRKEADRWSLKINDSLAVSIPIGDGCLADTTLLTEKFGFKQINKTYPSLYWGNGNWRRVDECYDNGVKPTKIIETKKGFSFEGTLNHKMKVLRNSKIEWIRTDEMVIGDRILIDRSYRWHSGDFECSDEQAYAMGAMIADGSWASSYQLRYATIDSDHFIPYLNSIFKKKQFTQQDIYHWQCCDKEEIREWLEFWQLKPNCITINKSLPTTILSASRERVSACLSALFDADGSLQVNQHKGGTSVSVSFSNTSKTLVQQIQYILLHYGIMANVSYRKRRAEWNTAYELLITGQSVPIFAKEIGFRLKRKQDLLEFGLSQKIRNMTNGDEVPDIKPNMIKIAEQYSSNNSNVNASQIQQRKKITRDYINQFIAAYSYSNDPFIEELKQLADPNIYYDIITSIKDSECHTYDIHVPDGHEYCANGFFSHNSKIRGLRAHTILCDEFSCLDYNTIVETDNGLLRIGDMVENNMSYIKMINKDGEYEKTTQFIKTKPTDTYRIKTKYGYSFECSTNHKVMTTDGWRRFKDLRVGDYLVMGNKYKFPTSIVDDLDEDLAWLMGLLVSEGYVNHKNYCSITTTDLELVNKVISKFAYLNPKVYTKSKYLDPRGWVCKQSYDIKINNTKFRDHLYQLGLEYVTAHGKKIPFSILKSPKNIVIAFLSGLFYGDGSCFTWTQSNKTFLGVSYYTVSEILAQDVQTILYKLNIISNRQTRVSKISKHPQWMIRCNGRYALKLVELLGISKWLELSKTAYTHQLSENYCIVFLKKVNKWLARVEYGGKVHGLGQYIHRQDAIQKVSEFLENNPFCVKIRSIDKVEKKTLYDLSLPETHSFYGNGFLQHNSISPEIYEVVISGFTAVSADPVANVKRLAQNKKLRELGLIKKVENSTLLTKSNQSVLSGTSGYDWGHFATYWKRYKDIIQSRGDMGKLGEILDETSLTRFDWRDFSVIRIPYELIPAGFMDEKTVARAQATMHSGTFKMEYSACGYGNSLVITDSGVKELCNVRIGDMVLTHRGRFRKVNKVTYRYYSGYISRIKTNGCFKDVEFTVDHPFWIKDEIFEQCQNIDKYTYLCSLQNLSNVQEIDVRNICTDYIQRKDYLYPKGSQSNVIDIDRKTILQRLGNGDRQSDIAKDFGIKQSSISYIKCDNRKPKGSIPQKVFLDYNFGLCVGYYASEGSVGAGGRAVKFDLDGHVDKTLQYFVDELSNAIYKTFNIKPKKYNRKTDNTTRVVVNSRLVAQIFKTICPGVCYDKMINHDILFSNEEFIKGFIVGVFNGDGYINNDIATIKLANLNLIAQIKLCLSYFNINVSILKIKFKEFGIIKSKKVKLSQYYKLNIHSNELIKFKNIFYNQKLELVFAGRGRHQRVYSDNKSIYQVINKDLVPYKGFVYNLEVEEDHSYSLLNATVHNCFAKDSEGFFRRTLVESCVASTVKPIQLNNSIISFSAMIKGEPKKKYIYGIDPASEVDNFSIIVLEAYPDHNRVVYCWTTNKKDFRERIKAGLVHEHNFYGFCARKIRDLMKIFPCELIGMDAQGGGIAVYEALHDADKLQEGELPIWEVIDPNKERDTDVEAGLHILEMVQFAKSEWTAEANHGMKKDLESKTLLFPEFDAVAVALASEGDAYAVQMGDKSRLYDSLETCMLEIEELKNEMATIVLTRTGTGVNSRDRWDTPEIKLSTGRKGRLRKDRYSALLIANMVSRQQQRQRPGVSYDVYGGFAHQIKRKPEGQLYHGPDWFTSKITNNTCFVVRKNN